MRSRDWMLAVRCAGHGQGGYRSNRVLVAARCKGEIRANRRFRRPRVDGFHVPTFDGHLCWQPEAISVPSSEAHAVNGQPGIYLSNWPNRTGVVRFVLRARTQRPSVPVILRRLMRGWSEITMTRRWSNIEASWPRTLPAICPSRCRGFRTRPCSCNRSRRPSRMCSTARPPRSRPYPPRAANGRRVSNNGAATAYPRPIFANLALNLGPIRPGFRRCNSRSNWPAHFPGSHSPRLRTSPPVRPNAARLAVWMMTARQRPAFCTFRTPWPNPCRRRRTWLALRLTKSLAPAGSVMMTMVPARMVLG